MHVCLKNNALSLSNFRHQLKRFLFPVLLAHRARSMFLQLTSFINFLFTY